MAVSDYSTTPSANASISGVNIAEGCPPGGINNAIRQMMADIRALFSTFWLGVFGATDQATARTALGAAASSDALTGIGTIAPAADTLPYFTGSTTADKTALSAFIRTLLDDADASTARATLGALGSAQALGIGQTWQDVTGSRASGVTYNNGTTRPIMVKVMGGTQNGVPCSIVVSGGVQVAYAGTFATANVAYDMSAIIPPGVDYILNYTNINSIAELR